MPRIEQLESGMWRVWVDDEMCTDYAFKEDAEAMLQELKNEKVIEAMEQYGGSFVKQLATLYRLGDRFNRAKIRETWSNYWAEYEKMAK